MESLRERSRAVTEEADQRAEILDRVTTMAVASMDLWVHFLSLGGNADHLEVMRYLEEGAPLRSWDRTVLSVAAHELTT